MFPWVSDDNPFNYIADRDYEREVVFQDFHLTFDSGEDLRWLIGLEYYSEDVKVENYSRANGTNLSRSGGTVLGQIGNFGSPFGPPVLARMSWDGSPSVEQRDSESWGIYGSVDWNFVEDWEISVSFRYQEDEFDIKYSNTLATALVPGFGPLAPDQSLCFFGGATPAGCSVEFVSFVPDYAAQTDASGDFDAFNPRVVLTHFYNDDIMLYTSIAKGTKPGGHTIEPDISGAPGSDIEKLTYDQEELITYEFGWKTSWANDRFIANGAIFFMDNTDKQANNREYVTASGTPRSFVDNIGESEVRGLELQLVGAITENWTASVNYAYLETEVTEFINQSAAGIPSPPRGTLADEARRLAEGDPDADQSGNDLPYTPKHNLQLSNTYDFIISDTFSGFVRLDGRYMSERWLSTNNIVKLDDRIVWDLKVGISTDNIEIVAYVDNLENDDTPASGVTFPDFAQNLRQQVIVHPNDKRTAGVRLKYNF